MPGQSGRSPHIVQAQALAQRTKDGVFSLREQKFEIWSDIAMGFPRLLTSDSQGEIARRRVAFASLLFPFSHPMAFRACLFVSCALGRLSHLLPPFPRQKLSPITYTDVCSAVLRLQGEASRSQPQPRPWGQKGGTLSCPKDETLKRLGLGFGV